MSDISLPYRPRAAEDPQAAAVVQSNLEYLVSLLQKGVNDGDVPQWDVVAQKYVSLPPPPGVPAGSLFMFPGTNMPSGYLLCDGQSVLRADYPNLFAALGGTGSTWGLPDGTHFNVPDLRGRVPVGLGTHADVNALGDNDGAAVGDRRPSHKHTVGDPTHAHYYGINSSYQDFAGAAGVQGVAGGVGASLATAAAATGVTVGPTAAGTPLDTPSFVTVNYIIKS